MRDSCRNIMVVRPFTARGFTLIELMIVVVIISILGSIALPAYTDYVRRGQLQEAFTLLADYRVKMEQYFQDNKNYGNGGACATAATASGWNSFSPAGVQYFTFACATSNSDQGYTVTATGSASNTSGYVYTIDHNGSKVTTMYKGAASGAACWLSRSATC